MSKTASKTACMPHKRAQSYSTGRRSSRQKTNRARVYRGSWFGARPANSAIFPSTARWNRDRGLRTAMHYRSCICGNHHSRPAMVSRSQAMPCARTPVLETCLHHPSEFVGPRSEHRLHPINCCANAPADVLPMAYSTVDPHACSTPMKHQPISGPACARGPGWKVSAYVR